MKKGAPWKRIHPAGPLDDHTYIKNLAVDEKQCPPFCQRFFRGCTPFCHPPKRKRSRPLSKEDPCNEGDVDAPPGPPRPQDRATPAPRFNTRCCGRKNGPQRQTLRTGTWKGALSGTTCSIPGKGADLWAMTYQVYNEEHWGATGAFLTSD